MRFDTGSERIALGIILVGTLLTFIARVITTGEYLVIGDDTGSYLTTLNFVQGTDLTGEGGLRPPLVGFYMMIFVEIFGLFPGAKIAALIASVSGAGAFYLVAKRMVPPGWAALGGIFFIWLPIYAETIAWGFLSVLVLTMVLLAAWSWLRYCEKPSLDRSLSAGAITAVLAYLNQTATPIIALIFGLFFLYLLIKEFKTHAKFLIPAGFLSVALAVSAIPYSLAYLTYESSPTVDGDPARFILQVKDGFTLTVGIVGALIFLYSGRKIGGAPGAFVMIAGTVTSITQCLTVPASLGMITILGRTILWLWMSVALLGLWFIYKSWGKFYYNASRGPDRFPGQAKVIMSTLAVCLFVFISYSWMMRFDSVMPYYTTLNDESLTALRWLKANTHPNEPVGVYPLPLAFHANGLANRKTITTAPEDGETKELSYKEAVRGHVAVHDEAVRCALGYVDPCTQDIKDLGVRYLITSEETDHLLAFQSGKFRVYDLEAQQ